MRRLLSQKGRFVLANVLTMVVLHGNTKQFWPKIPYLSLRDESVAEHSRLMFNTLLLVTLGQLLLRRLSPDRLPARAIATGAATGALGPLIMLGQRGLRLRPPLSEVYNLSLVWLLPLGAALLEDLVDSSIQQADRRLAAEAPSHE